MQQGPTPVAEWKKAGGRAELTLPSGNVCLVKEVDPIELMRAGSLPNALLPLVQESVDKAKKGKSEDPDKLAEDIMGDPEKIAQIIDLTDAVTIACVIEPQISPKPESETDRREDLLYVDELSLEDKMFVMNHAMGGSADLDQFREGLGADVVAGSGGRKVARPAKRAAGTGKQVR